MRVPSGLMVSIALAVLLAGGVSAAVAAEVCNPKALKGAYIFAQSGFKTGGETAAQRTPFAMSGRELYNGDGTMSGVGTGSQNGAVVKVTYKGTYTLNADCSGTVTFTDNQGQVSHYDIFATPDGSSFTWAQTDAAFVSAGWERRQ